MERGWGRFDEGDEVVCVGALGGRQRRHQRLCDAGRKGPPIFSAFQAILKSASYSIWKK